MSEHTLEQPQGNLNTIKICTTCDRPLPLDAFYPARIGRHGRRASCIECERKRHYIARYGEEKWQDFDSRRKRKNRLKSEGKKLCTSCHRELAFDYFGINKDNRDGLALHCRECCQLDYKNRMDRKRTPEQIQKDIYRIELEESGKRECITCHKIKQIGEFRGHRLSCRECVNSKSQQKRIPKRESIRVNARHRYYSNPVKSLFYNARKRARDAQREFTISLEDLQSLWELGKGKCSLSGIAFAMDNNESIFTKSPYRPSLDRIDNNKGYIAGNVRFVICALNLSINEYGFAIYLNIAQEVVRRHGDPFGEFARTNFPRSDYE